MIIHNFDNIEINEYEGTNIYVIKNLIDNAFCDKFVNIIDEFENNKMGNYENNIINGYQYMVNKESNKDIDFEIYKLIHIIFLIIKKINQYIPVNYDTVYHLRKITGITETHIDNICSKNDILYNVIKTLSIIICLNDNFTGGTFNFPNQNIKIHPKKGYIILFPPYWTHPHFVEKVSSPRYTITTWGGDTLLH